jgi:hypothetical protein
MISILKHRNAIVESRKNRHQSAEYERRRNFGVSDTSAPLQGSIVRELIAHSKRSTSNIQRQSLDAAFDVRHSMLGVRRLQAKKVG